MNASQTLRRPTLVKSTPPRLSHEQAVAAGARWRRQPSARQSSGSGQVAGPAYHRGLRWGSFVPG